MALWKRFSKEYLLAILEASVPKREIAKGDHVCVQDIQRSTAYRQSGPAPGPAYRPGTTHADIDFGIKLHLHLAGGYTGRERLDVDPFNELEIPLAVVRYRERYGCSPKRILTNKFYRKR